MIRNALLGLFAAGLALCLAVGAWPPALVMALLLAGVLFERIRYRPLDAAPPAAPGWRETGERFVDPETGALVSVWYDPASGARRYVAAGEPPAR